MWKPLAGGAACTSEDGAGADTPESVCWRAAYIEAGLTLHTGSLFSINVRIFGLLH